MIFQNSNNLDENAIPRNVDLAYKDVPLNLFEICLEQKLLNKNKAYKIQECHKILST